MKTEDRKQTDWDEFRGARPRVYGTNAADPEEGRVFVWTKEGWFEREEGSSGNVAFTPVAENEEELRDLISRDDPAAELIELGGEFRRTVTEEFSEQSTSFRDYPGLGEDEQEDRDEDQEYHQHDLE